MKLIPALGLLLMSSLAFSDIIVLKSGKKFQIPGSYEIKGQYVVFQTEQGQLTQLPLKAVDLEKSKEATEEWERVMAEREAASQVPKEVKKDATLAEIAEYVEKTRLPEEKAKKDIDINDENLGSYGDSNPRPSGTEVQFVPTTGNNTPEAAREERSKFQEEYRQLQEDIDSLNSQIELKEAQVTAAEQNAAFGDDPTEGSYDIFEEFERQLTDLRQQRANKEKEMENLEKSARQAGVKNYKRGKKPNN